jgi:hypothetical protein
MAHSEMQPSGLLDLTANSSMVAALHKWPKADGNFVD